jgi:murein DD-endopeptidase MepM/ murein hydrolase activator NlpD
MRFWAYICLLSALLGLGVNTTPAQPPARLQAVYGVQGSAYALEVLFPFIKQGRADLVRVSPLQPDTAPAIVALEGTLFNRALHFFQVQSDPASYYAFVTVPLNASQREHPLSVVITTTDGASETLQTTLSVTSGGFIQQNVTLVGDTLTLLDRDLEDSELALIFELAKEATPTPFWEGVGFLHPVNADLTSPFGAVRLFNGDYQTLHTGWDYQATLGKPMSASSAGVVVFASRLPIRGNYVLIHHGNGVYSGYAHLSVVHVTQGQKVTGGQIVGQVGSTGRSSSAHAHVEFIVNEQWIDSRDFIALALP